MEFKKFMEALKGNQHKLDKNKNGKLDAHDFKLLRKEEEECEYEDEKEKNEKEMDEAVERVARADYKESPSGRKTHKEITFKDGSPEVKEETELDERTMTDVEMKKREDIVKGMKKNVAGFKSKYGDRAKEVMYATATKMAMKEESELEEQAPVAPSLVKHRIGVTVSEPDHPMVSKRKEKVQKFVIVTHSSNKEGAKAVGEKFYKKKGYRVHDSHHAGMVNEDVALEEGYVVRYHNSKSEKHGSEKHFDNEAAAKKHADRGNSIDKVGGKYTVHKTNEKGHDIKEEKKDDVPFDPPYKKVPAGNVKDKSGATHTPMSQARHLARQAMKKQMKEEFDIDISDEQADTLIEAANLEQLDELSKGTLSSYVKKSSSKQFAAGHKAATADSGAEKKAIDKAQKRSQGVAKAVDRLTREGVDFDDEGNLVEQAKLSLLEFLQLNEIEFVKGRYVHKGTYGSSYQGDDDEDDDKPKKPAEPAVKRGRGRPAGSKSGANQKVGSGKSYGGIAHHSLNLPTSK